MIYLTRSILELALAMNEQVQDKLDSIYSQHPGYCRDYQTVALNLGRRSGHTTAGLQLATEHDVVIVPARNHVSAQGTRGQIMTLPEWDRLAASERHRFYRIFVLDRPAVLRGDRHYDMLYAHPRLGQQFVIIG